MHRLIMAWMAIFSPAFMMTSICLGQADQEMLDQDILPASYPTGIGHRPSDPLTALCSLILDYDLSPEMVAEAEEIEIEGDEESLAKADLGEIDRKLNNPLTNLWSLAIQNNLNFNEGDDVSGTQISNNLFLQPFMPIALGEDLSEDEGVMLGFRPVIPLVTNPVFDGPDPERSTGHDTGLGDMQLLTLVGPNSQDGVVWGVGATSKWPTASKDTLGSEKYQAGPAGMVFNIGKPWVYGALVQHWWSYAGDDDRDDISRTDLQYTVRYMLPDAWSVGMGPTAVIDWEADSDNTLTLPVGLGVTKTVRWGKMPIKLRVEGHYSVVRPDDYGQQWVLRFQITPVIPNPFK